jgi:hypothetical protein
LLDAHRESSAPVSFRDVSAYARDELSVGGLRRIPPDANSLKRIQPHRHH